MSETREGIGITMAGIALTLHRARKGCRAAGRSVACAIGRKLWRKDAVGATRRAIVLESDSHGMDQRLG